jgi:D-alanine-D-alanine ligase
MNQADAERSGKVRVAVLFGGQSDEHDVSLRSAQTVIGALDPEKYEVAKIGITRTGRWLSNGDPLAQLSASSPLFALTDGGQPQSESSAPAGESVPAVFNGEVDVVFPVLHGPMGEDGTVQGMLELAGLPYVGSGVLGSAVAMDKTVTKVILGQAGLPQAPWQTVLRKDWENDPENVANWIDRKVGYPCFTKPANMGSSVGISKVHDRSELAAAMAEAGRFDRKILVEQGVDARELEVSVLGNDEPIASVVGEIVPSNEFYDYNAKYVEEGSLLIVPAQLEGKTLIEVQELAITAFQALDLAGLARVDFFLDKQTDHIYINEVNTLPGFTAISMYPMLWEATGIPLPELVDRLIALAIERHAERQIRA